MNRRVNVHMTFTHSLIYSFTHFLCKKPLSRMKKSYLLIILFALFSNIISAQQDSYKWKVGFHAGGMGYVGDLNTRLINPQTQWLADPLANLRPSFGLSLEYAPGANFGLRALWSNGQFTANDRIVSFNNSLQTDEPNFMRGLNARTKINDLNLIGTFYLQRSRPTKKRSLSPYLMIGAGVTNFEVYGDLFFNNDSRYYYWSDFTVRSHPQGTPEPENGGVVLQDGNYETNLTELQTEDFDYETTVANIPLGLGFKWRLADRLSLNFETLWHYTFTDYLDDVSGVYIIDFDNPSPLQSFASNPSSSQNIWRGREEDRFNDLYSFNTISLNYNFGYRKDTPRPIDEIAYGNDTRTIKEVTTIIINEEGDTLKIEQQIREDDAEETARLEELGAEKETVVDEIAMLEEQLRAAGELPEAPEVEVETTEEVAVEAAEPELSRRERRRLERERAEQEIVIEEPETSAVEVVEMEQPETPETEVVVEPETTMTDTNIELPETPDAGGVVTEPNVAEGDRPARPDRPDISLGDEVVEEVVIEVEMPDAEAEVPDTEVEVEVPETRQSRRERRRNRNKVNEDIVIEKPEEPSVEIVVGENITIELPEEVEIEQPETPMMEVEVETPETPVVEVEVEMPETPEVEIEVGQPETPVVEVEIETPETPTVEVEVEMPETPVVEVEVETPETPVVEVEVEMPEVPEVEVEVEQPEAPVVEVEVEMPETPEVEVKVSTSEVAIETENTEVEEVTKKVLTRRDRRRMRRNPPDVNKDVEIDSEAAKVSEEVMATVPEEPVEEPAVEVETPEVPATENSEEIAVETPTAEQPTPSSRPTREGALDPKISSPSAISFNTIDDARKAYNGFYVPFEDEAYYVTKELYTELDAIVRTMNRFPSLRVTLQGHTSEQEGISFVHQEITRKRIHYIQNYLVTKGVALNRIRLAFFDDIANINEANKQQIDVMMN